MYRILLADDEGIMLESLKKIIETEYGNECEIHTAKTGRAVVEQAESYPPDICFMGVVEEKSRGISISKEQKVFIADLYKYSFVGIMLDWIKNGMKEDYHVIVNDIATALYGSIDNAIQNFSKKPSSLTEKDNFRSVPVPHSGIRSG